MTTATTKKPAAKKTTTKSTTSRKRVAKKDDVHVKAEKTTVAATPEITQEPVEKKHVAKNISTQNFYAVGKRKTAVAQAIITGGNGTITANELTFENYFQTAELRHVVMLPMSSVGLEKSINVRAKLHGGGIHAQAEALRHAISRAIIAMDPESRRTLKKQGFLTRDSRVKERKKPGLKRARRAPQFSKR